MLLRFPFVLLVLFAVQSMNAQHANVDSMIAAYRKNPVDTERVKTLDKISLAYVSAGEYDLGANWCDTLFVEASKQNDLLFMMKARNRKGNAFLFQNNYSAAIPCYFEALEYSELDSNQIGIAGANLNIGICYTNLKDSELGLEYMQKALVIYQQEKNNNGIASTCNSIGNAMVDIKRYDEALPYFFEAVRVRKEMKDERGLGTLYNNIGIVYKNKKMYDSSLTYYRQAYTIKRSLGDSAGLASTTNNIGQIFLSTLQYDSALVYATQAIIIAERFGKLDVMKSGHEYLSQIYAAREDYKAALFHKSQSIIYKDSMLNEENTRTSIAAKMNYEFDKQKAISDAEYNAELERRTLIQWFTIGGLVLLLLVALFIYSRFRVIRSQKTIIEAQKLEGDKQQAIIQSKNKEIVDSITYARHLQEAILPPRNMVDALFPQNFVLYVPKDIVAGDFYWMEKSGETVFVAAADCTGHGVPGAMVSVVCSNALNSALKEFRLREPGIILDKVRELVLQTFEKSASAVNDGMDIALCAITPLGSGNFNVQFAGANRPMVCKKTVSDQLLEIPGTKQTVGRNEKPIGFANENITLSAGDTFYLFTDGYADQFGGPKGKKLKYKTLTQFLLHISSNDMKSQEKELQDYFQNWRGNLEQVDDVLIVGIRL